MKPKNDPRALVRLDCGEYLSIKMITDIYRMHPDWRPTKHKLYSYINGCCAIGAIVCDRSGMNPIRAITAHLNPAKFIDLSFFEWGALADGFNGSTLYPVPQDKRLIQIYRIGRLAWFLLEKRGSRPKAQEILSANEPQSLSRVCV